MSSSAKKKRTIEPFIRELDRIVPLGEYRQLIARLYDGETHKPSYGAEVADIDTAESLGAKFVIIRVRGDEVHRSYVSDFNLTPIEEGMMQ